MLSTIHDQPNINEITRKPEIIYLYNSTKSSVDIVDQMGSNISADRKTKSWSLCIPYDMLNLCMIDAYIIHVITLETRKNQYLGVTLWRK